MRRAIIGILSVLVLLLMLVGGCGRASQVSLPDVRALATTESFTANGTFTVPEGVTQITVEAWGGGGGGGGRGGTHNGGAGGGGGGAYARGSITVTPGANYAVTVGAGGAGGSGGDVAGSAGGDSYFAAGSDVLAKGGAGGVGDNGGGGGLGGAASASTGTVKYPGGAGGSGVNGSNQYSGGGGGGAGNQTGGGSASASNATHGTGGSYGGGDGADGCTTDGGGSPGYVRGGGGSGAYRDGEGGGPYGGGAGARGEVRITYTAANQAPVAHSQSGLTVDSCSALTVTLTGDDGDGDPLTYKIFTLPGNGDLYDGTGTGGTKVIAVPYTVADATHKVTYDPVDSYSGFDSFGFKVNDGMVDSAEATVSITVSANCTTYYKDADGDGYGVTADAKCLCSPAGNYAATVGGDCDDNNGAVNPGATEVCNGIDDDCDTLIDEGVKNTYYRDFDSDGYGNSTNTVQACAAPGGYVADNTDCNDANSAVNPGATEVCANGIDDDCDGGIDEAGCSGCITYYKDADSDNYGVTGDTMCLSSPTGQYTATQGGDCNDANSAVNPGATEVCANGMDDDCDGGIDEAGCSGCITYYKDVDSDSYGVTGDTQCLSDPTGQYTATKGGDCNDSNGAVHPGATEVCANGIDDDCDGSIDEAGCSGCTTYYRDGDADTYGVTGDTQCLSAPTGDYTATVGGDCDDSDCTVYPGAHELFDGKDNDCDGSVDEGFENVPARHILLLYSTEGGTAAVSNHAIESYSYPLGGVFTYYQGTEVNITATSNPGYRFVGWTGGPDIIADVNAASTIVTIDRGCSIRANFAPEMPQIPRYDLAISSTAGGSVAVPGEGTFIYDASMVLDLVAKADSGYMFRNWTGDVSTIANVNGASTTITMNGDYSIVANFEKIPPGKVTLTVSSTDGGSVTDPGEATFTYNKGTEVPLKAEPEEGYEFSKWIGDVDSVADVAAASTTITMNGNYGIEAIFKIGGGCFIATAAYGTPMAEEIQILRDFRDEYLVANPVGTALVHLYYRVSPPIAEFISEHPSLKPMVRAGLMPAVAMSTVAVNTSAVEKVAILGLLVLFSVALAVWVTGRRDKGLHRA